MPNLFQPGVVLIPPDKETSGLAYVPGVIMSQVDGSVVGAVPNSVIDTSDGCVFADGTMCVNKHLTPFGLYFYDTNFNLLENNVVFPGTGTSTSPPSPVSDFAQWAYAMNGDGHRNLIARMNKSGAVDPTIWTLPLPAEAFAIDSSNTWLYYFGAGGSSAINSFNLVTNSSGPIVIPDQGVNIFRGTSLRVLPGSGDIIAFMANLTSGLGTIEVWRIAGFDSATPGQIRWKTTTQGIPGFTDPTMQIDVGTPDTAGWVRTYGGAEDRVSGCVFQQLRFSDGAVINQWPQTIAEVDGGVPGGILPATCPLFTWSAAVPPAPSKRPGCGG